VQISKKSRSHVKKIPGARKVTRISVLRARKYKVPPYLIIPDDSASGHVHFCNSMICLCHFNRLSIGEYQLLKNYIEIGEGLLVNRYRENLVKVSCLRTII
jgi:hypothetical protein